MPIAQRRRWDLGCQPLFTLGSRLGAFPFAVQVDDRHANDSPQFSTLLTSAVETRFKASEVSADAAYLVYENMQLAGTFGVTPYIQVPQPLPQLVERRDHVLIGQGEVRR
jgi:hypothetical protein